VALDKLPVLAPYVVETSAGNFHATFPLGRALPPSEAKQIAIKLSDAIGGDTGTKDVSHLWRIPGTLNWPSKTKLDRNRSAVPQLVTVKLAWSGETVEPEALWEAVKDADPTARAIKAGPVTLDWSKVGDHAGWLKSVNDLPGQNGIRPFSIKGQVIIAHSGNLGELEYDLMQAGQVMPKPYKSWSEVSFALAAIFKHDGRLTNEQIAAALMCDLDCNQHVTKQPDDAKRRRAVERLVSRSHEGPQQQQKKIEGEPDWRERKVNGNPVASMHNARLAVIALGIVCSKDLFHNRLLFGYADDKARHVMTDILGGEVNDDGILALRQLLSDRFGFDLTAQHTRDAVVSLALDHCFDPVLDLIDKAEAEWDGVERLDRMAVDYLNGEDTKINRAFIRKTMIGLIARARTPGCKFDTIMVLESKEGFNKSTAWRVLAGDDNFSDESIIGKESKEVQEQLADVWIHESADLAGMRKADVETVKAYASRQEDRARAAFAHFLKRQPRHSIEVGTTNSKEYLQSQTGNRRFWGMEVRKSIDIEKLKRDRMQLIGEAARCHSKGESVVLDEALWPDAAVEQEKRRTKEPWEDILAYTPIHRREQYIHDGVMVERVTPIIHFTDDQMEVVATTDLMEHMLKIPVERQNHANAMKVSNAMKQLGWQRHDNGKVTIGGRRVQGYFRPERKDSRDE
jgi:predicted P-loop ATPase